MDTRIIIIRGKHQRDIIKSLADNLPEGVEVVFRDPVKKRSGEANSYQWAAMLGAFESQAWIAGKQYPAGVWHEYLKQACLPDAPEEGITLKGYVKYLEMPDGGLRLVGSTTKLTVRGMAQYLEKCMALGGSLGVVFGATE